MPDPPRHFLSPSLSGGSELPEGVGRRSTRRVVGLRRCANYGVVRHRLHPGCTRSRRRRRSASLASLGSANSENSPVSSLDLPSRRARRRRRPGGRGGTRRGKASRGVTRGALTSTLHWFETEVLTEEDNYQGPPPSTPGVAPVSQATRGRPAITTVLRTPRSHDLGWGRYLGVRYPAARRAVDSGKRHGEPRDVQRASLATTYACRTAFCAQGLGVFSTANPAFRRNRPGGCNTLYCAVTRRASS